MDTHMNESAENYLEMIHIISQQKAYVRSVDIAHALGVTKPSVSHAMKLLIESGHIRVDERKLIHLTPSGLEIAQRTYERHQLISEFLIHLGVDEATAAEDACLMEHRISQKSFEALIRHVADMKREGKV